MRVEALPARLVAHQQLHRRLGARRVGVGAAGLEREEAALAEGRVEGQVDGVEQLPAAAEVALQGGQAAAPAQLGRGAVEDPHVGVAEAVDRLQPVADGEQAIATEQREDLGLQRVDVLELVHHHGVEAAGPAPAQVVAGEQEVAHAELEVVEVEAGGRALEARVAVRERDQQRVEDGERRDRAGVHEGLAPGGQRVAVALAGGRGQRGGAVAGQAQRVERGGRRLPARRDRRLRCRQGVARGVHGLARRGGSEVGRRLRRGRGRRGRRDGDSDRLDGGQARLRLPRRAQLGVGGEHHPAHAGGAVGGDDVERAVGTARPEHVVQRGVEGGAPQAPRLALVEHGCVGVEAGVERVGTQQPGAEAVDGRHRRGLRGPRQIRSLGHEHARPHTLLELLGRLLGEGDGEDALDRDAVLEHRGREPLDHHRRLAGPRAGGEQERTVAQLDGAALLRGQGHGWPARQTPG